MQAGGIEALAALLPQFPHSSGGFTLRALTSAAAADKKIAVRRKTTALQQCSLLLCRKHTLSALSSQYTRI